MISPYDIQGLLELYDIGDIEQVSHARRGFVNETAFITTTKGRFVIRRSHRRMKEAAHRYRHRLIHWLVEHDFPAPEVIPTRDGETLIISDGRFYEIHAFCEGKDFNPERPGQRYSFGDLLARYHQLVRRFPAPPDDNGAPRYSPMSVLGLTEVLLERDVMGDLYDLLSWYDLRAAEIRRNFKPEYIEALPHLVLHGDVHSDNVLFNENEAVALLDYDQATYDARVMDVADALIGFATAENCAEWKSWGVFRGPLDIEASVQVIAGYISQEALSEAELEILPSLVELAWLQSELGRVVSTADGAPEYHRDVLNQGQQLSGWMAEHREELLERWRNAATVKLVASGPAKAA
jgi:homoserine kinase type II